MMAELILDIVRFEGVINRRYVTSLRNVDFDNFRNCTPSVVFMGSSEDDELCYCHLPSALR